MLKRLAENQSGAVHFYHSEAVMKFMLYVLVMAGGVLNSLQSASNSTLKKGLHNPWISGVTLYSVALAAFFLVAIVFHNPMPTVQDFKALPWWAYFGGAMGGVAVYATLTATDQIGAGPLNAIIVTATVLTAMLMDHFGFMGVKQHAFNLWRGVGCVLMIAGVSFIAKF